MNRNSQMPISMSPVLDKTHQARSRSDYYKYNLGVLGVVCVGAIISPTVVVAKEPASSLNPCPDIFYEEPHNNRVLVPKGCPPNAITSRLEEQGLLPRRAVPVARRVPQTLWLGVGGESPGQTVSLINPCPSIYYEEPYNRSNVVPRGCRPNAMTQQLMARGIAPSEMLPSRPRVLAIPMPLPEEQQSPNTTVPMKNGTVDITLVNDTDALITYEVIGDTPPRSIPGQSTVTLRNLSAPTTVSFFREDGGLLRAMPQRSAREGVMQVRFDETRSLGQDRNSMRIQEDGTVFLN